MGDFVVSDETMHICILEPEVVPMTRSKTGLWRYMRPVYRERSAPCTEACPAGVRIRDCLELVREAKLREAWELILEDNPMPAITGRICPHPCEPACNRGHFDQSIAIHSIERFLGDYGLELPKPEIKVVPKKDRVAIIGSGPASLTCAYYLAKQGYQVTIFERLQRVGGALRYGSGYRMIKDVLDSQIDFIQKTGVQIKVSNPENISSIRQRYEAVFLGTAPLTSKKIGIPGEDSPGVFQGLDFLAEASCKKIVLGERIAVVGGGIAAIDAARAALSMGARELTILCRQSRVDIPASSEVEGAERDGIRFQFFTAPTKVRISDGKFSLDCVCSADKSKFSLDLDNIIIASGQAVNRAALPQELSRTDSGTIGTAPLTFETNIGVFAGGDLVMETSKINELVKSGKEAAISIDQYLRGVDTKDRPAPIPTDVVKYEELNTAYFDTEQQRKVDTRDAVIGEASRCFHCGGCNLCANCWFFCPDSAIVRNEERFEVDLEYCKGCGICAEECPRGVIMMEEESNWRF